LHKAKKYDISEKYLMPCISKSTDITKSFFTQTEFDKLAQENKNVFLFNATKPIDNQVEKYIKKGEIEKVNEKYLTASRNPWYSLENRPPAPIWVSVFHRNGMKFIRNFTNVRNLTTFHCIYLNMFSVAKTDLLFAYLLTDTAQEIFNDNRREYGNGLKKFEPNDINKAKMVDLDKLDKTTENKILDLYKQYQEEDLNIKPNNEILKTINDIFVNFYTD
jgi:adenine-specific DNA-methyltransferase